jgi:hypothetical protein
MENNASVNVILESVSTQSPLCQVNFQISSWCKQDCPLLGVLYYSETRRLLGEDLYWMEAKWWD